MSKKEKTYKYEIVESIVTLEEGKSNWYKELNKIIWGKGEVPSIDIRNIKRNDDGEIEVMGTGISLKDDACCSLATSLMYLGYIDREEIEKYLESLDDII